MIKRLFILQSCSVRLILIYSCGLKTYTHIDSQSSLLPPSHRFSCGHKHFLYVSFSQLLESYRYQFLLGVRQDTVMKLYFSLSCLGIVCLLLSLIRNVKEEFEFVITSVWFITYVKMHSLVWGLAHITEENIYSFTPQCCWIWDCDSFSITAALTVVHINALCIIRYSLVRCV